MRRYSRATTLRILLRIQVMDLGLFFLFVCMFAHDISFRWVYRLSRTCLRAVLVRNEHGDPGRRRR
jgi:hypothetical protein